MPRESHGPSEEEIRGVQPEKRDAKAAPERKKTHLEIAREEQREEERELIELRTKLRELSLELPATENAIEALKSAELVDPRIRVNRDWEKPYLQKKPDTSGYREEYKVAYFSTRPDLSDASDKIIENTAGAIRNEIKELVRAIAQEKVDALKEQLPQLEKAIADTKERIEKEEIRLTEERRKQAMPYGALVERALEGDSKDKYLILTLGLSLVHLSREEDGDGTFSVSIDDLRRTHYVRDEKEMATADESSLKQYRDPRTSEFGRARYSKVPLERLGDFIRVNGGPENLNMYGRAHGGMTLEEYVRSKKES